MEIENEKDSAEAKTSVGFMGVNIESRLVDTGLRRKGFGVESSRARNGRLWKGFGGKGWKDRPLVREYGIEWKGQQEVTKRNPSVCQKKEMSNRSIAKYYITSHDVPQALCKSITPPQPTHLRPAIHPIPPRVRMKAWRDGDDATK